MFFLPGGAITDSLEEFDEAWYEDLLNPITDRLGWKVQGFSEWSVCFYTLPPYLGAVTLNVDVVRQIASLCKESK